MDPHDAPTDTPRASLEWRKPTVRSLDLEAESGTSPNLLESFVYDQYHGDAS